MELFICNGEICCPKTLKSQKPHCKMRGLLLEFNNVNYIPRFSAGMQAAFKESQTIEISDDDEDQVQEERCKETENPAEIEKPAEAEKPEETKKPANTEKPTLSLADICRGVPKTHSTVPVEYQVTPAPTSTGGTASVLANSSTASSSAAAEISPTYTGDGITQLDTHNGGNDAGCSSALDCTEPSFYNTTLDTQSRPSSNDFVDNSPVLDDFDYLGQLDDDYLLKLFEEGTEDSTVINDNSSRITSVLNERSRSPLPVPDLPEEITTSASRSFCSPLPVLPDLPKEVTRPAIGSPLSVPDVPKDVTARRNPARAAKNNMSYKEEEEEENDEEYCEY